MNNLKSRVKKLEQSHGINTPQKLSIWTMYNARREPTEAEVEALKKSLDWRDRPCQIVLWNGEEFIVDLDDYKEADNPLTDAELAEIRDKRLAEIRAGL
jgi:hypothetical protein